MFSKIIFGAHFSAIDVPGLALRDIRGDISGVKIAKN